MEKCVQLTLKNDTLKKDNEKVYHNHPLITIVDLGYQQSLS